MLMILPSRWENPPSFIDNFAGIKVRTLPRCKRCAQGGVGTD
ncbi:hypothetical protein L249_8984 [Ophiocordyceps polyrhachis-furcata BCC 54312]|uniref:Uncharacterized protein n=1 Tax=Ophiocordyceps polyrhachis-furcata BCC 54312 TaxID=1330021 RepID=A0A367L254_9HYPO|nr:hypothetical protein L249_8984 [Ophiocordyceps polyrhachis-furcata BCC 54312]